jgi:hypothetical protein
MTCSIANSGGPCLHRYTPAWTRVWQEDDAEVDLDDLLQQMKHALEMADRNARLIHPIPWQEAQVTSCRQPKLEHRSTAFNIFLCWFSGRTNCLAAQDAL